MKRSPATSSITSVGLSVEVDVDAEAEVDADGEAEGDVEVEVGVGLAAQPAARRAMKWSGLTAARLTANRQTLMAK